MSATGIDGTKICEGDMRGMRIRALVVLGMTTLIAGGAAAQDWAQETVKLLERTTIGKHVCVKLSDGSDCGTEAWTITVQTDGTRTLRAHMATTNETQINLYLKVDHDYRPIESMANVYSNGRLFGTGFFVVQGDTLKATVNAPEGYFTEDIPLPDNFSMLLHPASADGWHFGYYDKQRQSPQSGMIFTLGAAGRSVLVAGIEMPLKFIGMETITVPAGTFETEHFRISESDARADVWVTGPDRMMVKHEYPTNDSRWLLSEVTETTE